MMTWPSSTRVNQTVLDEIVCECIPAFELIIKFVLQMVQLLCCRAF